MLKYSRQRESIKKNLASRCDHPTAEMVYSDIRKEFPNISLGTVYRNLTLLADLGEVLKFSTGCGSDRFDGDTSLHSHFSCRKCGRVIDLPIADQEMLSVKAAEGFPGRIDTNMVIFYGLCGDCLQPED